MVIFSNGLLAANMEHSLADAPVFGHILELLSRQEHVSPKELLYKDDGHCTGPVRMFAHQVGL